MNLPIAARERLTVALDNGVPYGLSPAGVKVTTEALEYGVRTVVAYGRELASLSLRVAEDPNVIDDASGLRRSAEQVRGAATAMGRGLWALSCLSTNAQPLQRARAALESCVSSVAVYLRSESASREALAAECVALDRAVDGIESMEQDTSENPLAELLQVSPAEVLDSSGAPSASRVLAAFYLRAETLRVLLEPLTLGLTARPFEPYAAAELAVRVLGSAHPFIVLESGSEAMFRAGADAAAGGSAWSEALEFISRRQDRSAFSLEQIALEERRISLARTEGEAASILLNVYRRVLEGHLRPAMWFLLCTDQSRGNDVPLLSGLGDAVRKYGGSCARVWDEAVVVAVRNAGAHEDFTWDHRRGVLRSKDTEVTLDELRAATAIAKSFAAAIDVVREFMPSFFSATPAMALGAVGASASSDATALAAATTLFGSNGLHVRHVSNERGVFRAEVERLNRENINPCLQALTYGSRYLDCERFEVYVNGSLLIDVTRAALDATFPVWWGTLGRFPTTPLAAFLPANWSARSKVERPMRAARSAAWIAADDALDAWNDLHADPARTGLLAARLGLVDEAVSSLLPLIQEQYRRPLHLVRDLVGTLRAHHDVDATSGLADDVLGECLGRLDALHATWSRVPRLPTVPGS